MKMPFALIATLTLAVGAGFAPASAVTHAGPVTLPESITLDTALTPQYYGAGEYDGVLHLTIEPDGAINGWYREADVGRIRTVIGGLDGNKIWLDLGTGNSVDLNGTFDGGKITASTYLGDQLYTFTATPMKS